MKRSCAMLAALILAALMGSIVAASSSPDSPKPMQAAHQTGLHDFDFLIGEWRVHHRVLNADSHEWVEFDGTSSTRKLMDGWGNVEDNVLNPPSGAYRAVGLRAYDPKTGQWAIWWLDGRNPLGTLDPPVQGRFENAVGNFYSGDTLEGKPIRTRYTWSHITPTSARWEQAYSFDAGRTWDTNWIMEFRRVS